MNDLRCVTLIGVLALTGMIFPAGVSAQQGVRQFQCGGAINGVPSEAVLEITPGGLYTEGPGVAGQIRNRFAGYTFNGILFGGSEGFVALVDHRTGERIDRVWIGLGQSGFALRTEDGATYAFHCRG